MRHPAPSRPLFRALTAVRRPYRRLIARRHRARGPGRAALYLLSSPGFLSLARGPADQARLVAVVAGLIVADLTGREQRPMRKVMVSYGGERLAVHVDRLNDLDVLREVFVQGQYDDLQLAQPPRTILDLGAHVGAALLALHVRFPQAQLAAAEADPATFRRLERNLAPVAGARLIQAALTERDSAVEFLPTEDAWVSGLAEMTGRFADGSDPRGVPVRGLRFDTMLDELGLERADLVKVDIEGAEWMLVNTLAPERVGTVVMEWHVDMHGHEPEAVRGLMPGHEVQVDPLPTPGRYIVTARPR